MATVYGDKTNNAIKGDGVKNCVQHGPQNFTNLERNDANVRRNRGKGSLAWSVFVQLLCQSLNDSRLHFWVNDRIARKRSKAEPFGDFVKSKQVCMTPDKCLQICHHPQVLRSTTSLGVTKKTL